MVIIVFFFRYGSGQLTDAIKSNKLKQTSDFLYAVVVLLWKYMQYKVILIITIGNLSLVNGVLYESPNTIPFLPAVVAGAVILKGKATFEAHFHVLPIESYTWLWYPLVMNYNYLNPFLFNYYTHFTLRRFCDDQFLLKQTV